MNEFTAPPYELEITPATQHATVYCSKTGKPLATVQRRRVYSKGPAWRAFDLDGKQFLIAYSEASLRWKLSQALGLST